MYAIDGRSGQRLDDADAEREPALTLAYERRIRPLCLCSAPGVPVYIARVAGAFVLKRMPFTGGQHAAVCVHFEPPRHVTGRSNIQNVISDVPGVGRTRLRATFSLFDRDSMPEPRSNAADDRAGQHPGTRLNLRGLLHFLWREAELTRWRPGFAGKRTWAVVRNHLLNAARNKDLAGQPLQRVLFVPETFSVAAQEHIRHRRNQRFLTAMKSQDGPQRKMIMIGEVKEIVPTQPCPYLLIKHLPDLPFKLDAFAPGWVERQFGAEVALWHGNAGTHLLIAATFSLDEQGSPIVSALSFVITTRQWLPVDDSFELQLIERLVREGRCFEKALGLNSTIPPGGIRAVLTDMGPARPRLVIDRHSAPARSLSDREGNGMVWRWEVGAQSLPSFPLPDRSSVARADGQLTSSAGQRC